MRCNTFKGRRHVTFFFTSRWHWGKAVIFLSIASKWVSEHDAIKEWGKTAIALSGSESELGNTNTWTNNPLSCSELLQKGGWLGRYAPLASNHMLNLRTGYELQGREREDSVWLF